MPDTDHDPAELIEAYFERGWTAGLPVVPPPEKSIAQMLDGAGLRGEEIIGQIPARNVVVTADKVAINAVLAGCRPGYLPVVVAAIRGLCHPDFAYHGPASSTGGSAIVLIVNGPIARAAGVNSGNNVFGQGVRANATIGRAVRLVMMNVMNTRPGILDLKRAGRRPGPVEPGDETTWKHAFENPDDLLVVCAGGRAGAWSACLPGWGNKWTRSVTTLVELP